MSWLSNIFGGGREEKDYHPPKFESNYQPPGSKDAKKATEASPTTTTTIQKPTQENKQIEHKPPIEEDVDDMFGGMEIKEEEEKLENDSRSNYVPPSTQTQTFEIQTKEIKQEVDDDLTTSTASSLSPQTPKLKNLETKPTKGEDKKRTVIKRRGQGKKNESPATVQIEKISPTKTTPTQTQQEKDTKETSSNDMLDLLDFTGMEFVKRENVVESSDQLLSSFLSIPNKEEVTPNLVIQETRIKQEEEEKEEIKQEPIPSTVQPPPIAIEINKLEEFNDKKRDFNERVSIIIKKGKDIIKEKRKLISKDNLIKQEIKIKKERIKKLNEQIIESSLNEDFVLANELNEKIKEIELNIIKEEEEIEEIRRELKRIEELNIGNELIDLYNEFLNNEIELILKEQKNNEFDEIELKFKYENERLESEKKKNNRMKETIEYDMEDVSNRINKMNEEIESQTLNERKNKKEFLENIDNLNKEIEELELKLNEKKKELSFFKKKLLTSDEIIKSSEKKFERELHLLLEEKKECEEKNQNYKKRELKNEMEYKQFEKDFKQFEESKQLKLNQLKEIKEFKLNLNKNVKHLIEEMKILKDIKNNGGEREIKGDEKELNKLNKLNEELKILKKEKEELNIKLESLKLNEKKLNLIHPTLVEEKQLAISKRDFKLAQKLTLEIKDIQSTLNSEMEKEKELNNELEVIHSKIKQKEEDLSLLELQFKSKLNESNLNLYKSLLKNYNILSINVNDQQEHSILKIEMDLIQVQLSDLEKKLTLSSDDLMNLKKEIESEVNKMKEQVVIKQPELKHQNEEAEEVEKEKGDDDTIIHPDTLNIDIQIEQEELLELEEKLKQAIDDEEFELCDELNRKITNINNSLELKREKLKQLKELNSNLPIEIANEQNELDLLEEKLNKAIEEEEYDLCDDLNIKITKLNQSLQLKREKLKKMTSIHHHQNHDAMMMDQDNNDDELTEMDLVLLQSEIKNQQEDIKLLEEKIELAINEEEFELCDEWNSQLEILKQSLNEKIEKCKKYSIENPEISLKDESIKEELVEEKSEFNFISNEDDEMDGKSGFKFIEGEETPQEEITSDEKSSFNFIQEEEEEQLEEETGFKFIEENNETVEEEEEKSSFNFIEEK